MKFLNSMQRLKCNWLFYRLPILFITGSLLSHPILIAADEIDPSIARGDRLEEIDSSIARGGRLYDKWFSVVNAEVPETAHPAYPAKGRYKGKNGADWRCKECHGWDYMGRDGAYSKGKYFTGIKGIRAYDGVNPNEILKVLQD